MGRKQHRSSRHLCSLPFEVLISSDDTIVLANGTSQNISFIMSLQPPHDLLDVSLIASSTHDFLDVGIVDASGVNLSDSSTDLADSAVTLQLTVGVPAQIFVTVAASEDALPGTYKILLGGQSSDIAVSKYLQYTYHNTLSSLIPLLDSQIGITVYSTKFCRHWGQIRVEPVDFEVTELVSEKIRNSMNQSDGYAVYKLKRERLILIMRYLTSSEERACASSPLD